MCLDTAQAQTSVLIPMASKLNFQGIPSLRQRRKN